MSDQHGGLFTGFMGDPVIRTPNLDSIAASAAVFTQAYTSCPLCVPARASMMCSRFASSLGVYSNMEAFASHHPTFAHSFAREGYETVLCGRMHFLGEDQRHGFEKRIANDITSNFWGNPINCNPAYGDFQRCFGQAFCLEVIGEGKSPVLSYDEYVTGKALDYLQGYHDRPQLLVVGTYAPHSPLIGPKDKYRYYHGRVLETLHVTEAKYPLNAIKTKMQYPSIKHLEDARAAYYAMVEQMDEQIGTVHTAWLKYLKRNKRDGIFVYLSDHGDSIGEKHLFGKQTFFENSTKIPWIISGDGIKADRIDVPVSIMDLGPTLCGLSGIETVPVLDGQDQSGTLRGDAANIRPVLSEFYQLDTQGKPMKGHMVREGTYKFISYSGYVEEDLLFDLASDPYEEKNILSYAPEIGESMRSMLNDSLPSQKNTLSLMEESMRNWHFLNTCGNYFKNMERETWLPPPDVVHIDDKYKHPEYKTAVMPYYYK
jgi:choline-sulfatase